jgi:dienelactone hydrolase
MANKMRKIIVLSAVIIVTFSHCALAQTIESETVEFFSEDGVFIKGSYYYLPASNQKYYPGIIILPEFRQSRTFWRSTAVSLAEKGYAVLTIDFRGQGESTQAGETILNWAFFSDEYIKLYLLDVKAAVEFLQSMPSVDQRRIVIMGSGLGANAALIFASQNERVRGLILLSAGLSYRGLKTEEAIVEYNKRPLLMIVGEDDSYSLYSSKKLLSLAQGEKELKIYTNAGRGAKMLSRKPEIIKKIFQWLERYSF